MANKVYLPNLPIVGEEGTWESIVELIRHQLLPKIDAIGDKLFRSDLCSLTEDVILVPIVSENWSRPRQDGTPQFVYAVSGQGLMLIENKLLTLTAGQGFYLPKGTLMPLTFSEAIKSFHVNGCGSRSIPLESLCSVPV